MEVLTRTIGGALICICAFLAACGPSEEKKAFFAEKRRVDCLDKLCPGDTEPHRDWINEVAFKLNGQWYIGPRKYGNPNLGPMVFFWPSRAPGGDSDAVAKAPEIVRNKVGNIDNFSEVGIEIFLRSSNIPPEPRGYKLIELAQANEWIESRRTLRRGLDEIKMKHVVGPQGQYIDHLTYYVATDLKGFDGLPPVAGCNHDDSRNGGGAGFMWAPAITAGARMNQRHCADWPEIYSEIARVLHMLRKAQP
jgi:hypothetical protein